MESMMLLISVPKSFSYDITMAGSSAAFFLFLPRILKLDQVNQDWQSERYTK
jgi:hypothetical protein